MALFIWSLLHQPILDEDVPIMMYVMNPTRGAPMKAKHGGSREEYPEKKKTTTDW